MPIIRKRIRRSSRRRRVLQSCGTGSLFPPVGRRDYTGGMASILVFAPHPDDAELGMGGTIIKLARQGHRVHVVDVTNGEPTPFGSVETRAKESAAAAKVLGVERTLAGLKNREVVHDIAWRHKIAAISRPHQPDSAR